MIDLALWSVGYLILAASVAYVAAYAIIELADRLGLLYSPAGEARRRTREETHR